MKYAYLFFILLFCGCQENYLRPTESVRSNNLSTEDNMQSGQERQSKDDVVVDGIYYGTSEGKFGRRAWLLKVGNGDSLLYSPPGNLIVRNMIGSPEGHIAFETDRTVGDLYYKFTGRVAENRIDGEFEAINANNPMRVPTTLLRIDPSVLKKQENGGLFSNVEYVEQGGDLVGSELIVIPFFGNLAGIYTSYENEMIPYATKIEQNGDKIRFDLQTEEGVQRFEGTFSLNEIRVNYVGIDANPEVEQMVLLKKQELTDLFRK